MSSSRLYVLAVFLFNGPVTKAFIEKNPVVSRTVEIRGDQTLADLHQAIFDAFDREEQHMYEFQIGGKGPQDPEARHYTLPVAYEQSSGGAKPAGDVTRTTIASLNLQVDQSLGYWFDFGDDWWHQINVVEIKDGVPKGQYPRVTERTGESPPQYVDYDDAE